MRWMVIDRVDGRDDGGRRYFPTYFPSFHFLFLSSFDFSLFSFFFYFFDKILEEFSWSKDMEEFLGF